MDQIKIWQYFQIEATSAFKEGEGRLRYIARRLRKGESVLNIGVGDGTFEALAVARGIRIHVLDPVEPAVNEIRERFQLGDRARVGLAQRIPFDSNTFDTVVMAEVMEHLDDEALGLALKEVHRVLVRGGRLLGTVPAWEDLARDEVICPSCGAHFHRWGHQQTFRREDLRSLLSGHFAVKRLKDGRFPAWHRFSWKRRAAELVRFALRKMGIHSDYETFFFEATKKHHADEQYTLSKTYFSQRPH